MRWPIGSEVVVLSFGKRRGVVVAQSQQGRYRVRVDAATVSCQEHELVAPPVVAGARRRASRAAAEGQGTGRDGGSESDRAAAPAPSARIDLHGLLVEEAMARVMDEIDRALQRGAGRLEVIHGKGSGRIKAALHRLLRSIPTVVRFELDSRNPGVTWVYF